MASINEFKDFKQMCNEYIRICESIEANVVSEIDALVGLYADMGNSDDKYGTSQRWYFLLIKNLKRDKQH